jgi:DNA mismatch repair protein MutS
MGGRLLRRRIITLKSVDEINRRLSLIDFLNENDHLKYEISQL